MRLTQTHRSADSLVRVFQTPVPDSRTRLSALRRRSAFTLVEIAISMAIIGFAVVAIIGVLPLGLNVQKDNREETIINNEASFFMDAIRSGARGLDDLTNHVYAIKIVSHRYDVNGNFVSPIVTNDWTYLTASIDPIYRLNNGSNIIGLLSTPKFTQRYDKAAGSQSNYVMAYSYAMSGSAGEQLPQTQANIQNFAFAHRMIVENYPVVDADARSEVGRRVVNNLHEIRLTFRWPLYANGKTGAGTQTYRTLAGGSITNIENLGVLYFFEPQIYTQAQ